MTNVLMVLTSHDRLGDTGRKTGFWLEEFAAPYYVFKDAGVRVTLASPAGGQPPLDPKSDEPDAQTDATRRFRADPAAQDALAGTRLLASVKAADHDAVFYPGGHGPLWDLADSRDSRALIEATLAAGKPVAAVCHAPGVLRDVRAADGSPLVRGKRVTGFTNGEEAAVGLSEAVPFQVEDMLRGAGAHYLHADDWQPFVVTDGLLVTGQNPASSEAGARALLAAMAGTADDPAPDPESDAPGTTRPSGGEASQRESLEASEKEAAAPHPDNYKEAEADRKVVEVAPLGGARKPIEGLDNP